MLQAAVLGVVAVVVFLVFRSSDRIALWLKNVLFTGEVANVPRATGLLRKEARGVAVSSDGSGAPAPRVASTSGVASGKDFPRSAEERQQLLRQRKQQMVEEARRKYLEKLTGGGGSTSPTTTAGTSE